MSAYVDATGVTALTADIKALADATYPSNEAVAPEYDATSTYEIGDYCIYSGMLYKCNTAIATGGEAWNAAHWTQVSVSSELHNSLTGLNIMSYGNSTWADFIDAYTTNSVVYCRASSNSNPASGSQTRLAFMAYVNNAANPTEVEFQYYRSVATHSASQQGDQVYVYKLNKNTGWNVTTRNAFTKIVAGTNMTSSYSNGVLTLNSSGGNGLPSVSAADNGKVLRVVSGEWTAAELPSASGVSF